MSVCVNTKSKEFRDAVDRLNISQGSLENIVHEYINAEGNVDSFPSDSYILSKIEGEPFTEELSEKAQKLIELKYSKPIVVNSYADAQAIMRDISQYFDSRHIGLKETKDGKFEVSLAKTNVSKSKTPLKEHYRGKLIFAQSGTGKTHIADNNTVIDSDIILANILGTSPESASFIFQNLSLTQKEEFSKRYRNAIREEVKKGNTVLTSNPNLISEADVLVYNKSVDLTNSRTSAENRRGTNKYNNSEKAYQDITKAKAEAKRTGKEAIELDENHHLADYLLTRIKDFR